MFSSHPHEFIIRHILVRLLDRVYVFNIIANANIMSYLLPCLTILIDDLAGVVQTASNDTDPDVALAVAIDESVEGDCSETNTDGDLCILHIHVSISSSPLLTIHHMRDSHRFPHDDCFVTSTGSITEAPPTHPFVASLAWTLTSMTLSSYAPCAEAVNTYLIQYSIQACSVPFRSVPLRVMVVRETYIHYSYWYW
jgi:hypothetical protein